MIRMHIQACLLLLLLLVPGAAQAREPQDAALRQQPSTIVQAQGTACMGDENSRRQTREQALALAKREASALARTHVSSSTTVAGSVLRQDIIRAYSQAGIRVLNVLERTWYADPAAGQCHRVRILAEVIPDATPDLLNGWPHLNDPTAPLTIRLWTDKDSYRQGESVRMYLEGNKPFYARVVHRDVSGRLIQLLPNPLRGENRFLGGVVYQVPGQEDTFDLKVVAPLGQEKLTVYAGTRPLGDIRTSEASGFLVIDENQENLALRTRAIVVVPSGPAAQADRPGASSGNLPGPVEFFETSRTLSTSE